MSLYHPTPAPARAAARSPLAPPQVVGRLAPQIAKLLMGKHKPTFMAHVDAGDYVVVVNAQHVAFTGKKSVEKLYRWHTGWMGGLKTLTARQMMERDPRRVLQLAVKGMLPKNALRDHRLLRLKVFPGEEHEHAPQVARSVAFAADHLASVLPLPVPPRPKASTGALVVNAADVLGPAGVEALQWAPLEHDDSTARKYQTFQSRQAKRRARYQKVIDTNILARAAELDVADAQGKSTARAVPPQMR